MHNQKQAEYKYCSISNSIKEVAKYLTQIVAIIRLAH